MDSKRHEGAWLSSGFIRSSSGVGEGGLRCGKGMPVGSVAQLGLYPSVDGGGGNVGRGFRP